jgi:membrane protein required for colicin V production
LSLFLVQRMDMPVSYNGVVLASTLLVAGMVFGALLRRAVGDVTGSHILLLDRITGAFLGAGRVALLAVLIVVIFDRIIPVSRQPAFLTESQLYPYLSAAGKAGMQALPHEVTDYIDELKRERGL